MQLNIHVSKARTDLMAQLEAEATASGRPKNEIVLDALEAYLRPHSRGRRVPRLREWDLGADPVLRRE